MPPGVPARVSMHVSIPSCARRTPVFLTYSLLFLSSLSFKQPVLWTWGSPIDLWSWAVSKRGVAFSFSHPPVSPQFHFRQLLAPRPFFLRMLGFFLRIPPFQTVVYTFCLKTDFNEIPTPLNSPPQVIVPSGMTTFPRPLLSP